jgi:transcription initiation factor TFIIIB Brf1 subunit/transcription initiation factor TFIIB
LAQSCLGLASKIEEVPRSWRHIINVFQHIKRKKRSHENQVSPSLALLPISIDKNYFGMKKEIFKAEMTLLKELGFCVHVKNPHKFIVVYLRWLEMNENTKLLQMAWNCVNDSLSTDLFVRYSSETIACAAIFYSARMCEVPLPSDPYWYEVLGVEVENIHDWCYRVLQIYKRKSKPSYDQLEKLTNELKNSRKSEIQKIK